MTLCDISTPKFLLSHIAIEARARSLNFGADNARSGSDCERPTTNTNGLPGSPEHRYDLPQSLAIVMGRRQVR